MSRRLRHTALATAGVIACALASLAAASPATAGAPTAAPAAATGRAAVGDLTGDGVADRVSIGALDRGGVVSCAYTLQAGLGGGRFAAPVTGNLPVYASAPESGSECPDLAVVLRGPTPAQNQLAVTWFQFGPTDGGPVIRTFHGFANRSVRKTGSVNGIYQPSVIGARDFDGDGFDDIWENTDQGGGFQAFVGRSSTGWRQLYASPFTNLADPQFFDLNRAGGTDILVTWAEFSQGSGAAAVDGRTGAVQVLARHSIEDDGTYVDYDLAVIDVDHNAYPDLQLTTSLDDGTHRVDRFVNRSTGGRWYFQKLAS